MGPGLSRFELVDTLAEVGQLFFLGLRDALERRLQAVNGSSESCDGLVFRDDLNDLF